MRDLYQILLLEQNKITDADLIKESLMIKKKLRNKGSRENKKIRDVLQNAEKSF